jgi:hypothetical protein
MRCAKSCPQCSGCSISMCFYTRFHNGTILIGHVLGLLLTSDMLLLHLESPQFFISMLYLHISSCSLFTYQPDHQYLLSKMLNATTGIESVLLSFTFSLKKLLIPLCFTIALLLFSDYSRISSLA